MSFNLHLTRHLGQTVRNFGPLFIKGCFELEDLLGKLGHLAHGTREAGLQIASNLSSVTKLRSRISKLNLGPAKLYCNSLLFSSKNYAVNESIRENIYSVGIYHEETMYHNLIRRNLLGMDIHSPYKVFSRLWKDGYLHVASEYKRGSRLSSFIKCHINRLFFAEILTFVRVENETDKLIRYYALVNELGVVPSYPPIKYINSIVSVKGSYQYFVTGFRPLFDPPPPPL